VYKGWWNKFDTIHIIISNWHICDDILCVMAHICLTYLKKYQNSSYEIHQIPSYTEGQKNNIFSKNLSKIPKFKKSSFSFIKFIL